MIKQAYLDVMAEMLPTVLPLLNMVGLRIVGSADCTYPDSVRLVLEGDAIPDDCNHIKAEFSRTEASTTITFLPVA